MKYKMVAIDLDGTLLNDQKTIPDRNKYILKKLSDMSVEFVIATGRRYWSAKQFSKELGMDLIIMANNGNIVRRLSDDKILVKKYLDKEDFYTLIREGRELELFPITHVDHYEEGIDIIVEFQEGNEDYSQYMKKNMERFKQIEDMLKYQNPRALVVCYFGKSKTLEDFKELITEKYPNKYNCHIMSNFARIGSLLEIMNPLGSKWFTLNEYAKSKGINPEEIIAIGDDNNDLEMIRNAGLGIAMKDCSNEVKKAADMITDKSNNEAGVGVILSKIFNIS